MTTAVATQPILEVRDLHVHFRRKKGWFSREETVIRAVNGVSFDLFPGETLGLVGESGCGKSTLSRAVLRLIPPTSGSVLLNTAGDQNPPTWQFLHSLGPRALRQARKHIQLVFQDPFASLNPRMTVGDAIAEPIRIFRLARRREIATKVQGLMREVGLDPKFSRRYPHQFSGGQRQRIGIARALALNPKVIFCDEPVSALDVSIRAQVLNLLMELQRERGLSYVFIAHDLSVVRRISHRVAVMYLGKIVELAPYDQIYRNPMHPYTQALLSAIPVPDPAVEAKRQRIPLIGEIPSPAMPRVGCDFASRCPKVMDPCRSVIPPLLEVEPGHHVACHLHPGPRSSDQASEK
ncbi:MAG: oligopeptide/dipeptide ABC transporter ATP-binding protein [Planctomycetota bacterium]